jgi:transcriptional regulator with XRE-family HTH domain
VGTTPTKRRLLAIKVKEISLVDTPAIDEEFVLVKRDKTSENDTPETGIKKEGTPMAMPAKIQALLEKNQMTVEKLAETTGIDLEKLSTFLKGEGELEEDDFTKMADAFGVEKLDDEEDEKEDEPKADDAPPADAAKQEDEEPPPPADDAPPAPSGDAASATPMHKELMNEKLGAISAAAQSLAKDMGSMDLEDVKKTLRAMSNAIWSIQDTADIALLTKRADTIVEAAENTDGLADAIDNLSKAMDIVKSKLGGSEQPEGAPEGETEKVKKSASTESKESGKTVDISSHPDFIAVKKQADDLAKKVEGLSKMGLTKGLGDDDHATGLKKDASPEWSFLGNDIK